MTSEQSRAIATQEYFIPTITPVKSDELRVEVQEKSFGHSTADLHIGVPEDPSALAEVVDLHDVRKSKRGAQPARTATRTMVSVGR